MAYTNGSLLKSVDWLTIAIYIVLVTKNTYTTIILPDIINPISSPITEKIKSVVLGDKYPNCV
jgi:hypothetical protein